MCEQAISVPDGLKTGPIFVDGVKLSHTGDAGTPLSIFPSANGVQHCEVAGMRDTLDAFAEKLPKWGWLQRYIAAQNWETKIREMNHEAPVDPTVKMRAALDKVTQCAGTGPYRPEALRNHNDFKQYYQPTGEASAGAAPAPSSPSAYLPVDTQADESDAYGTAGT